MAIWAYMRGTIGTINTSMPLATSQESRLYFLLFQVCWRGACIGLASIPGREEKGSLVRAK